MDLLHGDIGRHQEGQEASVTPVLSRRVKAIEQSVITFFDCISVITDMNDRSPDSLKKNEHCLWAGWSCLWRPDVTLESLDQLVKDLEVVILQLPVRFQCVCTCTVLNPAQANCLPAEASLPQYPHRVVKFCSSPDLLRLRDDGRPGEGDKGGGHQWAFPRETP